MRRALRVERGRLTRRFSGPATPAAERPVRREVTMSDSVTLAYRVAALVSRF
jgi:hypothetical protein